MVAGGGREAYLHAMLADPYSNALLDLAGALPPAGRLADADASATKRSRVCGSELTLDLKIRDGVVSDYAIEAKACALGQAAAGAVSGAIVGATAEELRRVRDEMRAMLKEGGPAPSGERWAGLKALAPIRDYPARHASTLLVFEAVVDCLDQVGP